MDGVPRLLDKMTKEQLALKIAREIYKGKGKLESFHAFQCIRSYFYDLSMDDLEGSAGQGCPFIGHSISFRLKLYG